jgi:hypothetical protein
MLSLILVGSVTRLLHVRPHFGRYRKEFLKTVTPLFPFDDIAEYTPAIDIFEAPIVTAAG